jgi:hypothetical protein
MRMTISTFPINPNATGDPRIDIIVCEHQYVDIPGASIAIYSVIQGTPDPNPVAPPLTAPDQIKIIIGQLYVPAGTAALTDGGVIYTPSGPEDFAGDATIVHTNNNQTITGEKKFQSIGGISISDLVYDAGTFKITASEKNNFYNLPAISAGTDQIKISRGLSSRWMLLIC